MLPYVAVIPSIYQPYTDDCIASCKLDNMVVVDNTIDNRGVARSWNIGIRNMYERHANWLIIISAAVRFGEPGGLDLVEALTQFPDAIACEGEGYGWHLIAFNRRTVDRVGLFDENFYPGPFGDNDYGRRITLRLAPPPFKYCTHCGTDDISGHHHPGCPDPDGGWIPNPWWPKVAVAGCVASIAHSSTLGHVGVDSQKMLDYYEAKWGGPRQGETFYRPFGDETKPIDYWPLP
jgi:hypothetical protein